LPAKGIVSEGKAVAGEGYCFRRKGCCRRRVLLQKARRLVA